MSVKLKQLPNGKWYKLGSGKPVEATDKEVALWESAQQDVIASAGEPESVWKQIGNLAKWTTFSVAALTFLNLLVDWSLTRAKYSELGVPQLASAQFVRSPMHISGVIHLAFYLVMLTLAGLFALLLHQSPAQPILERIQAIKHIQAKRFILLVGVMVLMLLSVLVPFAGTVLGDIELLIVQVQFLGIIMTTLTWLCVRDLACEPEILKGKLGKGFVVTLSSFTLLVPMLLGTFVGHPTAAGRNEAREVLRGQRYNTPVSLVTDQAYSLSDQVLSRDLSDGRWLYASRVISDSDLGLDYPSLQYLGEDEDNIYLLDVAAARASIIPREHVDELSLWSFSEAAQRPPDLSCPADYFTKPTPTSAASPRPTEAAP